MSDGIVRALTPTIAFGRKEWIDRRNLAFGQQATQSTALSLLSLVPFRDSV
jgi:hypothetical protein